MSQSDVQKRNEYAMGRSIDIRRQKAGTIIRVETTQSIYELKLLTPETGLVSVTGSDQRLVGEVYGHLNYSVDPGNSKHTVEGCIVEAMRMHITFKNGVLVSHPTFSASIEGNGWSYQVF